MKNLNDQILFLPFAPYVYGEFIHDRYYFTAIIKSNSIQTQDLANFDIKDISDKLIIASTNDKNIYIWLAKVLYKLINIYYQKFVKWNILESVRWEDFIFGEIIENQIKNINSSNQGFSENYIQFIKSFTSITQKVFEVNTMVMDWFDFDVSEILEIFWLKSAKVVNWKDKNPILKIAYIYNQAEILEEAKKLKSENANYINEVENPKDEEAKKAKDSRSEYIFDINKLKNIYIPNGRELVDAWFSLKTEEKPKLLLHICCAPDLTYPLHWLKNYFKIYLFWYNPNIHPRAEHDLRYEQYVKLFQLEKWDYEVVEDWYDPKEFFDSFVKYRNLVNEWLEEASKMDILKVAGEMEEWSSRCDPCYLMRLEQAATMAAKLDIPYFTSTLLISPKKVATKLFRRGLGAEDRVVKSKFLRFDFAKKDGYNKASELTKDYDLYRQNYCGCGWTIPKKWEPVKEYKWG